jgi:hypothetical protein
MCKTLTKFRLNFCINRKEVLMQLMPALTTPGKVPIEELNLAANRIPDSEWAGEIISKIIVKHCEHRDQIFWKYGLRNDEPPFEAITGIKRFDLSYNKLGENVLH